MTCKVNRNDCSFTLGTTAATFFTISPSMSLSSRPLQVDRELERARRLLEQSEDSRESLVQQVCHFARRRAASRQHHCPSLKKDVFVWVFFFCLTLAPIPRWRDCAVSCCGRRGRRRSSRGLGWRLSSPARCRMATTSTGRRVEVDGERQVLDVGPSQQTGGVCWGCRF